MKLRKSDDAYGGKIEAQIQGRWIALESCSNLSEIAQASGVEGDLATDMISVLQLNEAGLGALQNALCDIELHESELCEAAPDLAAQGSAQLPFAPRSFRDFMLFEKHVIDATRGYARRFLPGAFKIARLFEAVTRKPFAKFKPHALWYKQPIYYFSNHLNFIPSEAEITWPHYSSALDYELELGAILAKPLLNASEEEAKEAIGGFVVLNDFSARDRQRAEMESGFGPQKAKHFNSALSQIVVTADEIIQHIDALTGSVWINGDQVASCSTAGSHHSLASAIAFASQGEQLHPGELFGSGTLPGGSGMENGHWLSRGDTLSVRIDQIGEITNRISEGGQ